MVFVLMELVGRDLSSDTIGKRGKVERDHLDSDRCAV